MKLCRDCGLPLAICTPVAAPPKQEYLIEKCGGLTVYHPVKAA